MSRRGPGPSGQNRWRVISHPFSGAKAPLTPQQARRNSRRFLLKIGRPLLVVALRGATFTCFGKDDGGGAQVHAIASVAAFAKYVGARFVHTPLETVAHCPSNTSMAAFCQQWDNIVSLFGFPKTSGETFTQYRGRRGRNQFLKDVLMLKTRGSLICFPHAHSFTDEIPGIYDLLNPPTPPRVKPRKECLQIAVHVRRGDVGPSGWTSDRYSPDRLIRNHIDTVRGQITAQSRVAIVTEDLKTISSRMFSDCEILVHEDPLEALAFLVEADILIMAKSSFSFVAGLLSSGQVYYSEFWHAPLPSWNLLPTEL